MEKDIWKYDDSIINSFCICSYGIKICIRSNEFEFLEEIKVNLPILFPEPYEDINKSEIDFYFDVEKQNNQYTFYINHEKKGTNEFKVGLLNYFLSILRLTIAEHAVSKVFIHAGVVGWKGKGIVIPASSFQGKTTLVSELIKIGAEYYSDEYAVLDENGFVHPFSKPLSVRGIIDDFRQKELTAESFGGTTGLKPVPVGMIILTGFEKNGKWSPEYLTVGQGMLEIISHTIPIRYNTKFTLEVLNKTLNRAIIAKSKRGDAKTFAPLLLDFFEKQIK